MITTFRSSALFYWPGGGLCQVCAPLFDQVLNSQSADVLAAAQAANSPGLALGGDLLTQEQGWIAGSGDDILNVGAGTNVLVGGDGIDTAVYSGARSDYKFLLTTGGNVEIVSNLALGAGGNVDTIHQIEQAQFSDGTIDISFTEAAPAQLQQVGLMYQVALGRAADLPEIAFWVAKGFDALTLAQGFTGSAEFQNDYGAMSNAGFVAAIELNALHQTADVGTVATWTTYLDAQPRRDAGRSGRHHRRAGYAIRRRRFDFTLIAAPVSVRPLPSSLERRASP